MFVYVLNQHGEPLMPCSSRKARILLKQQKAKVFKRTPFTIQLLYGSSGYKQPISLGVDAGTKHVGLSASTEKQVLLEGKYNSALTFRNCWRLACNFEEPEETARLVIDKLDF